MFDPFGGLPVRFLKIIYYLPNFIKLFWRLFRDPQVAWYKKAIPILGGLVSITYVIFPFDILPDPFAFIGQFDDTMVVLCIMIPSIYAFIRLCPKDLVRKHAHEISKHPL